MGCTDSKDVLSGGRFGPTREEALRYGQEETLGDEIDEDERPSGWPYEAARLREVDYEAIIEEGEPWTDPDFPPGAASLFINGQRHR